MITPFDHFMRSMTTWLDTAWYLWAAMAAAAVVVVVVVVLAKSRARSRRRVPQYRRQVPTR